jgi:hypothetical protein
VTDHEDGHGAASHGGDEHSQPHMPPNSAVPVMIALSLAVLFVGFLSQIRDVVGPVVWLAGLLGVIVSCAVWARSARREYFELPEDGEH